MKPTLLYTIVISATFLTITAHATEPWSAAQRGCVADLEEKCAAIGGANCSGWWPSVAQCAIRGTWGNNVPESQTQACINWVQAERLRARMCNACGNPIRDVIHCATGL